MSCYGGGADVVPAADKSSEYMEQVERVKTGMYAAEERIIGRGHNVPVGGLRR